MKLIAEYVSPGHPDRLCDNVVKRIVDLAVHYDDKALVGIECAVHTNNVFIDGRIAQTCRNSDYLMTYGIIEDLIREVYADAGYNKKYGPDPNDLIITNDVCLDELSDAERKIRKYSDDQNIVCGFAINDVNTRYLPIEHYLANYIGENLWKWYKENKIDFLGPDFKVMVEIEENYSISYSDYSYDWNRLTLSFQHDNSISYEDLYKTVKAQVDRILAQFVSEIKVNKDNYKNLKDIDDDKFLFNGAGDFIDGGPNGDNGLSGKKLVIDYYGPRVPIGGGAIYGKDYHKVDFCGAFRARQFALQLLKENNSYMVYTKLAWSPGDEAPYLIDAYGIDRFGTMMRFDENKFPARDWFSIDCINKDNNFKEKQRIIDYY